MAFITNEHPPSVKSKEKQLLIVNDYEHQLSQTNSKRESTKCLSQSSDMGNTSFKKKREAQ